MAFALPWAQTGNRLRSGYSLASVLRQSHLVQSRLVGVVILCVLVMPLFAAITVAADLTGAARVATVALLATTLLVGACVFAVGVSETGSRVAAATAVVALAGGLNAGFGLLSSGNRRRP